MGVPVIEGKTANQVIFSMVATAIRQLEARYGCKGYGTVRPTKINHIEVTFTDSTPNYIYVVFPEKLWQKNIEDTYFFCFYYLQHLLDKGLYRYLFYP